MINLILSSFYLALPAYCANMAPVIMGKLRWFKFFDKPVDNGNKISGQYIFGKNKTWRGIIAATLTGLIIASIQAYLYSYFFFYQLSLFDYQKYFFIFGLLAGLGAILGDLIKSFFKRRIKIESGKSWPIFDQLDFIFGFFIFTSFIYLPNWEIILVTCLLTLILHPLTNITAYFLKIKKVWW